MDNKVRIYDLGQIELPRTMMLDYAIEELKEDRMIIKRIHLLRPRAEIGARTKEDWEDYTDRRGRVIKVGRINESLSPLIFNEELDEIDREGLIPLALERLSGLEGAQISEERWVVRRCDIDPWSADILSGIGSGGIHGAKTEGFMYQVSSERDTNYVDIVNLIRGECGSEVVAERGNLYVRGSDRVPVFKRAWGGNKLTLEAATFVVGSFRTFFRRLGYQLTPEIL